MIRILFVCLGNICRSPMAEGMFLHLAAEAGIAGHFRVDSAGTGGWHEGEKADRRMRATAQSHGVELVSRARKVRSEDFQEFDYIIPMDRSNYQDLRAVGQNILSEMIMMRHFDPQAPESDVPDPYMGDQEDFEEVYQILERSNRNFLTFLREKHHI
jgi:protein-tyrosine phosphatase